MPIPKTIHYVWVGPKPLTPLAKRCIASWKKHLPGYEIKLWNEKNSPMDHPYVQEMYKNKKWAFVSDYIRFWAIEKEGGIYLDTDMEVLKNLDEFLNTGAFFAKTSDGYTACGIIGSVPNHPIIQDILNFYNKDTQFSTENTSPKIVTKILEENSYKGVTVHPAEKFFPCDVDEPCTKEKLKHAYTNHHWAESWVPFSFVKKPLRAILKKLALYNFVKKLLK